MGLYLDNFISLYFCLHHEWCLHRCFFLLSFLFSLFLLSFLFTPFLLSFLFSLFLLYSFPSFLFFWLLNFFWLGAALPKYTEFPGLVLEWFCMLTLKNTFIGNQNL